MFSVKEGMDTADDASTIITALVIEDQEVTTEEGKLRMAEQMVVLHEERARRLRLALEILAQEPNVFVQDSD